MKIKSLIVSLILFLGFLSGYSQPFINDINLFKEIDKETPPPQNAILFIGSSSFTMWYDVNEHFPEFTIINRGFGGSTLEDQIRYVNDIVFPYSPKQIVIYCGENDFAASDTVTVEIVTNRFIELFSQIRTQLPEVPISYVSMKPSPSRWHLSAKFSEANHNIENYLVSQPKTSFISIWNVMLGSDSLPDMSIFLDDSLHMNYNGYEIWRKEIYPHLIK
jgi:lysophospholipase L1-like esterase